MPDHARRDAFAGVIRKGPFAREDRRAVYLEVDAFGGGAEGLETLPARHRSAVSANAAAHLRTNRRGMRLGALISTDSTLPLSSIWTVASTVLNFAMRYLRPLDGLTVAPRDEK